MSEFKATRWTLLGAAQLGDEGSRNRLVDLYRAPVLRHLRAEGAGEDAEDLAQEVFLRLFHAGVLAQATPTAGRFRNLLLAVTRNVLRAHRTKAAAKKRGGGLEPQPLDAEQVPRAEQDAFDREWVLTLLERAVRRLAEEHPPYHEAMSRALRGATPAEIAAELGRAPKDVRNHLHRARQALGRYLREEAWNYTADPEDHATELALLTRFLPKPQP